MDVRVWTSAEHEPAGGAVQKKNVFIYAINKQHD